MTPEQYEILIARLHKDFTPRPEHEEVKQMLNDVNKTIMDPHSGLVVTVNQAVERGDRQIAEVLEKLDDIHDAQLEKEKTKRSWGVEVIKGVVTLLGGGGLLALIQYIFGGG